MIDNALGLLILVVPCAIGLYKTIRSIRELTRKRDFALNFHNMTVEYANSQGKNAQLYNDLLLQSNAMQRQLGAEGVIVYSPEYANHIIPDYQIIVNLIPELRNSYVSPTMVSLFGDQVDRATEKKLTIITDALVRHVGTLEDLIDKKKAELRNPVALFQTGIQAIVAFPISIFRPLGPISISRFLQSGIVKVTTSIAGLVALVSGIVTIVVGWSQFWATVSTFLCSVWPIR